MTIKKLLFYLLAGFLSSCIPVMSLRPLYTKEDTTFEDNLIGTWVNDSNETTWQFKRINEPPKAYELIFSDAEGNKGFFVIHLVKLESRFFLDVYPSESPCGQLNDPNEAKWPYNKFFLIPAHTFVKIEAFEPQLRLRLTDDEGMKNLLKEYPNAVKHETVEDYNGSILLTASTKELKEFVLRFSNDSRLFTDEIVLTLQKAKITSEPNCITPNETEPNSTEPNKN